MKVKMKNIEAVQTYNRLEEFVNKDKPVPKRLSFSITHNMKSIISALEPYHEELKKVIDNESISQSDKNTAAHELQDIEIDVDIRKESTDIIPDDLSTKDIFALDFMLEEPESQSE